MPSIWYTLSPREPWELSVTDWKPAVPPTSTPPRSPPLVVIPGRTLPIAWTLRPVGIASRTGRVTCWDTCALCTSTRGDAPDTVTDSSNAPTFKSALTCAVKFVVNSMPSCLKVVNPGSVKVTEYVPGSRFTILYWPLPSVTAERVFSISAGLDASTVTPGRTPPDVSLTTPASVVCAYVDTGRNA